MATQEPSTESQLKLGRLDDGRPTSVEEDVYRSPLLPGFEIVLAEVIAR